MILEDRQYQTEAIEQARAEIAAKRNPLINLVTGGGKTVIAARIAQRSAAKKRRSMFLVHRAELIRQTSRSFDEMGIRHGIVAPGFSLTDDLVQVASVQTLVRKFDQIRPPHLLFLDEAHHVAAGSWRKIIERFRNVPRVGLTATPERLDGRGLGEFFDSIVPGPAMAWLIEQGFLAGYDYFAPPVQADLSGCRTSMGDYNVGDLAAAMSRSTVTGDAVEHYRETLNGRPAIAFCVRRDHSEQVVAAFRGAGFRAATIDGTMTASERQSLLSDLANGRLNVLASCELINEGVDVPVCSGAILLRPTKSLTTFLQQVGRVLRRKPDGSRAVILDHVGNVHKHGLPDTEREWNLEGRKKRPATPSPRTCKTCFAIVPAGSNRGFQCAGDLEPDQSCPILAPDPAARQAPDVVDGKLEQVKDWTFGIPIDTAKGRAWFKLLELADTEDKLREIARARGFKRGWVQHRMRERVAAA